MKKLQLFKSIGLLLIMTLLSTVISAQGVTTASINGTVTDTDGQPLIGATVIAIHVPSGSQYGTVTRIDGGYTLPAMRVGGPYTITTSYTGFQDVVDEGIFLSLGQDLSLGNKLSDTAIELEGVTVVAAKGGVLNSEKTGAETLIGEKTISSVPTVSRDFNDFIKLTPQASTTADGGISIAGTNNRYNSIFIDGAVNNDVFGLSDQGTNGGQTEITPISIDAIEEFQVVLAPYDVRLGGFAGGGINAVTRSGSNKFEGSAYWFTRNQDFVGKTHRYVLDSEKELDDSALDTLRTKVDDFSANTFGFRLGGPIVKNKVFFFINAELQRDQTPQPFDFLSNYEGDSSEEDLNNLASFINSNYGYDAGGFLNNTRELQGEKILARLDFNLGTSTKLKLRHSYTKGTAIRPSGSSNRTINFYNGGVFFPSTTHSSALELNSVFGSSASNDLIIGYTNVFDDRDPMGADFPRLTILDGDGQIRLGSEIFSTANQLKQNILILTDNFSLYKGKHTITIGTHNEFYNMYNLFMRRNFGEYEFGSVDDFISGAAPTDYEVSYSLVDDIVGDGSAASASFNSLQLGFYVQDRFAINDKFKLTYGLRLDVPLFLDQPVADENFNTNTIPAIRTAYADETEILDALDGAEAGQLPQAALMLSPRIGFNYDVNGNNETVIRGGVGVFTSRVPFVWPGGSFTNNGLTIGAASGAFDSTYVFNPDINTQPQATDFGAADAIPSGQIDFFSKDFKYPQVLRGNIGVDQKLPGGFIGGFDAVYTKTLNNVIYYNLNIKPSSEALVGADARPLFNRFDPIDDTYGRIILGDNTNEGYTYNFTMRLERPFNNGLLASIAYSFGDAWAINDGTSSQNSSQWRYIENSGGRNHLGLSRSDFSTGMRLNSLLSYQKDFNDFFGLTASIFYEGRSGRPFSYIYNGRVSNGDSSWGDLIFVPADASQINLVDSEDWAALDAFISGDDYLNSRRGQFAERNGSRLPFEHNFDLKLALNVGAKISETTNKVQVSLDILNFGNLLNKDWGAKYFVRNDQFTLIRYEGLDTSSGENIATYSFNAPSGDIWNVNDFISRWRMVLGVRYIFE